MIKALETGWSSAINLQSGCEYEKCDRSFFVFALGYWAPYRTINIRPGEGDTGRVEVQF